MKKQTKPDNITNEIKHLFSPEVPVLLVGAAGIGKTDKVKQCFDYTEVLLLSTCQPEDIGGIPYREGQEDHRTISSLFTRLHEADKQGKTTALFLDELDKAQREVADTLLTLVAHRKINQGELPKNTCIIAAANPPEFGGGDGISVPMLNRFAVIEQDIDLKSWVSYMKNRYSEPFFDNALMAFEDQKIPVFEVVGEGLEQKITSPRSIDLAFKAIKRLKQDSVKLVEGLLTPNVAQKLLNHFDFYTEYSEVLDKIKDIPIEKLRNKQTKVRMKGIPSIKRKPLNI
jgi:hypothetical protein